MEIDPIEIPVEPARQPKPRRRRFLNWKWLALPAAGMLGLAGWYSLRAKAPGPAGPAEAVVVAVAKAGREDVFKAVNITAEFRPYVEVNLHAKVSGYLSRINVDFGDQVKSNQLLATLEVPELRDQLHSAVATEQKAQADYTNAHLIFLRLQGINHQYTKYTNIIAQQAIDTAEANDLSTAAAIAAAKADREKFETLVKYTQITAPFDGVITKRYADPGALIQSGTASDTQSMPLVRISDNYHLRLDFPVSVDYVQDIHLDDAVDVRVESLGGRTFTGKISRFTHKVEEETRTMIAEIEVPNPQLELVPGMYATVILKVERRPNALTIPSQAVSGGKEPTVYVINENREIQVRAVTLGLETPGKYEVTSGLNAGELVVVSSRALLHPGQQVEPKITDQLVVR